jgi:Mn-dependent DtxR family transcriptional regulator
LDPYGGIALRIKSQRPAKNLGRDLILLERHARMIKGVFSKVAQQAAEGLRRVEAMAFGKSLYLLEAFLTPNIETVCYGHITREVTNCLSCFKPTTWRR